jgi:lysophospholipase L1-like esterase
VKRWVGNVALLVVGLVAGLTMAEAAVRVFGTPSESARWGYRALPDGRRLSDEEWAARLTRPRPFRGVRYMYPPNRRWLICYPGAPQPYLDAGGCVEMKTGPHGFRAPEGEWVKPPGTLRLLVVGDSVTFGMGVPSDSVYTRMLERELQSRVSNVDVVNMGVEGYMAGEELALLKRQGLQRSPDLVVWQFHINDLVVMRDLKPQRVVLPVGDGIRQRLQLVGWLENRITNTRHLRALARKYGHGGNISGVIDERTTDFLEAMRAGGAFLRDAGLPCVAMLYPYPDFLSNRYPFKSLHELFEGQCLKHDFTSVDLLPTLTRLTPKELWVAPRDHHPNGLGHRVMAQALSHAIRTRFGEKLEGLTDTPS